MKSGPPKVVDSVLELIGNTPVIRIQDEGPGQIWAKCEHLNPGRSLSDRAVLAVLESARASGELAPGAAIIEATRGNTGMALATFCAVNGYSLELTVAKNTLFELRQSLDATEHEVHYTPSEQQLVGALEAAERIREQTEAFMPRIFESPMNEQVHYEQTACEILDAFGGESIIAFVSILSTDGILSGIGKRLRETNPGIELVGVEVMNEPARKDVECGPDWICEQTLSSETLDYLSRTIQVRDEEAYRERQRVAAADGLLVGMTSAANIVAARRVARAAQPGQHIVTVLCDTGERYFSLDEFF